MQKEIKITIIIVIIFILIIALIKPRIDYYLREGDVIMMRFNMEKVSTALNSWSIESSGRFPQSIEERTEETNESFKAFLLKEDWYEPPILPLWRNRYSFFSKKPLSESRDWYSPIKKRNFAKVVNFKPLMDSIPGKIYPCRIYVYTDGIKYKIIGGDKKGFLIPQDSSLKRDTSNPKIIYSENYWENE